MNWGGRGSETRLELDVFLRKDEEQSGWSELCQANLNTGRIGTGRVGQESYSSGDRVRIHDMRGTGGDGINDRFRSGRRSWNRTGEREGRSQVHVGRGRNRHREIVGGEAEEGGRVRRGDGALGQV